MEKARELEIIESGNIWYKEAIIHDTDVEVHGDTAIIWSRITSVAHVRGNDFSNEFTVTEIFQKKSDQWKLLNLTFRSERDTHVLGH